MNKSIKSANVGNNFKYFFLKYPVRIKNYVSIFVLKKLKNWTSKSSLFNFLFEKNNKLKLFENKTEEEIQKENGFFYNIKKFLLAWKNKELILSTLGKVVLFEYILLLILFVQILSVFTFICFKSLFEYLNFTTVFEKLKKLINFFNKTYFFNNQTIKKYFEWLFPKYFNLTNIFGIQICLLLLCEIVRYYVCYIKNTVHFFKLEQQTKNECDKTNLLKNTLKIYKNMSIFIVRTILLSNLIISTAMCIALLMQKYIKSDNNLLIWLFKTDKFSDIIIQLKLDSFWKIISLYISVFITNLIQIFFPAISILFFIAIMLTFAIIWRVNTKHSEGFGGSINKIFVYSETKRVGLEGKIGSMLPWLTSMLGISFVYKQIIRFVRKNIIFDVFSNILCQKYFSEITNNNYIWYISKCAIIWSSFFVFLVCLTKVADITLDTIDFNSINTNECKKTTKIKLLENLGDIYGDQNMILFSTIACLASVNHLILQQDSIIHKEMFLTVVWTYVIINTYGIISDLLFKNTNKKSFNTYLPILLSNTKELLVSLIMALVFLVKHSMSHDIDSSTTWTGLKVIFFTVSTYFIFSFLLYLIHSITSILLSENIIYNIKNVLFSILQRRIWVISLTIMSILVFMMGWMYRDVNKHMHINTQPMNTNTMGLLKRFSLFSVIILLSKNGYFAGLFDFSLSKKEDNDQLNFNHQVDFIDNFEMYKTKTIFSIITLSIFSHRKRGHFLHTLNNINVMSCTLFFSLIFVMVMSTLFTRSVNKIRKHIKIEQDFPIYNDNKEKTQNKCMINNCSKYDVNTYIYYVISKLSTSLICWTLIILIILYKNVVAHKEFFNTLNIFTLLYITIIFNFFGSIKDNTKFIIKNYYDETPIENYNRALLYAVQNDFTGDQEKDVLYNIIYIFTMFYFIMLCY